MEHHYGETRVFVYNMHPVTSLDTAPCSDFSKTTKRHLQEIPFLDALATQTGAALSDLSYNNRFTSSELLFNLFNPRGKFCSSKSGDICQSTAADDVNGSVLLPDSSSTFNHSL